MWAHGSEFNSDEWPKPGTVHANDAGKRVHGYWSRSQAVPGFPRSPRHPEHGIHLPAILPRGAPSPVRNLAIDIPGSTIAGLVPDSQVDRTLPMPPQYSVDTAQRIGSHEVEEGERFYFVGFPPDDFRAENAAARQVVAYFAKHRDHPKLMGCPWCCLKGLFLPTLPERPKVSGTIPLDTEKYSEQIDAEVEQATGKRRGQPGTIPQTTRGAFSTGIGHRLLAAFILKNRPKEA